MTDITAEPATRANKATPKAQATARRQAPASIQATAKPAVDEASLAAARAMGFVSVLMSGIRDVNDFAYLDEHVDQFVKLDTHVARLAYGDENDQPVPISGQDIADVHQMFVTAIATLDAAAPTLPGGTVLIVTALARQALEVVKQIADAFEASAATLEPLKALGEYSGLRPFREEPRPPIRRVEDASRGPYNQTQLFTVLTEVASMAMTLSDVLALAGQSKDEWQMRTLIDSANVHVRLLGAMADTASGCNMRGDHDAWIYGPNFADEGKAGAA